MKLHRVHEGYYAFHCPGCEHAHEIPVTGPHAWQWNGSMDVPTLRPSLLVNVGGSNPTVPICHSWVTDGNIQYLADSTHKLSGQTIPIPEWDD